MAVHASTAQWQQTQTHLIGKLTMVGFFSIKKLFLLNLCRRSDEGISTGHRASGGTYLDEEDEIWGQLGDLKSLNVGFPMCPVFLEGLC